MGRNLVAPEVAERNRTVGLPGGYTFDTLPPDDYEGVGLSFVAVRVGDHAHVEVESGRVIAGPQFRMGYAGKLTLRWHEWLILRDILEPHENVRVAEVEKPTQGQAARYSRR